jgi:hypothetical protein
MNFIKLKSNRGLVNLLSDFILSEINVNEKFDTIIEVSDFGRFFVVNGLTSRSDVVDLSIIKDKFKSKHSSLLSELGYEDINIIDIIIYGNELTKKDEMWFTFYRSQRPCYNNHIINLSSSNLDYQRITPNSIELNYSELNNQNIGIFSYSPMTITSEFPHGYSFNMGRGFFYYSEYVCNHLFGTLSTDEISIKFSSIKNIDDDFDIDILTNTKYSKEKTISLILDVFDFDLNKFKDKLVGYNYEKDITEPFGEKPWLVKDEIKNIIMF